MAIVPSTILNTFQGRSDGGVNIAQELGQRAPSPSFFSQFANQLQGSVPGQLSPQTSGTRQAPTPFTPPTPIQITGGLAGGGGFGSEGGFSSSFQRGPGTPGGFVDQMDPFLTETLQQRARGEGIGPSFEDIIAGVFDPQAERIDEQARLAREQSIEDLVSRGVLSSSTAAKSLNQLTRQTELDKRALFGQLALDFNNNQQRAIGEALGQLNILEGNKLSSRTTITAANIQASATVAAASIGAGATVAAARIGAQARLQEAGMNANVALAKLQQEKDMTAFELGVDLSDPQSVQDYYDYKQYQREQEKALVEYILEDKFNTARGN